MRLNTPSPGPCLCYNIRIEGWGLPGKVWEEGRGVERERCEREGEGCERGGV